MEEGGGRGWCDTRCGAAAIMVMSGHTLFQVAPGPTCDTRGAGQVCVRGGQSGQRPRPPLWYLK